MLPTSRRPALPVPHLLWGLGEKGQEPHSGPPLHPCFKTGGSEHPWNCQNQEKWSEWQQLVRDPGSRVIASSGETWSPSGHPAGWATRVAHET